MGSCPQQRIFERPAQAKHGLTRRGHIQERGDEEMNATIQGELTYGDKYIPFADENLNNLMKIRLYKVKTGQLLIDALWHVQMRLLEAYLMSERKIRGIMVPL